MEHIICIKIGGRALTDEGPLQDLLADLAGMRRPMILVHGGGAEVSRVSKQFGLTPRFVDGIRHTSESEMDVVDMVLAGKLNTYLIRRCEAAGRRAVGLTGSDGGLFQGTRIHDESRTGRIEHVDTTLLFLLLKEGYVPVIASTSMEPDGTALNINADEAALAVASAFPVETLVFLSDIPGILVEDRTAGSMNRNDINRAIAGGVIIGGMIPKVRSSLRALEGGVGSIVIGRYESAGDMRLLLEGGKGTRITL